MSQLQLIDDEIKGIKNVRYEIWKADPLTMTVIISTIIAMELADAQPVQCCHRHTFSPKILF